MQLKFDVITVFPEMIQQALEFGVVGQAIVSGEVAVKSLSPRQFKSDVHKAIDDRPFGGGDGMVFLPEVLEVALLHLGAQPKSQAGVRPKVVYLSPQGKIWNDSLARRWARERDHYILISGRYGGIDERVIAHYVDEEISIGDYVLSGGELAALVLIDSIVRFVPGTLGNEASLETESFSAGLLEAPLYTRPREFAGMNVPEALLSGHHSRIQLFRLQVSILRTVLRRPDLLNQAGLSLQEVKSAWSLYHTLSGPEREVLGLPQNWKETWPELQVRLEEFMGVEK